MKEELLIYKKGEATALTPKPFTFELAMEGYIADNPNILSNPDLDLKDPEVKETELDLGDNKGRIDILLRYANDDYAIVELKNKPVDEDALKQLLQYLNIISHQKEEYSDSQFIGILVGPEIKDQVIQLIETDKTIRFPIYAVSLNRYFDDGKWFIFTKWYSLVKTKRDYTKYLLNSSTNPVGKGKLVFEVIKHYVSENTNITFAKLQEVFPDSLRNVKKQDVKHHTIAEENSVDSEDRYSRYFKEPLWCADCSFVVSSQWGKGNINTFIAKAKSLGCKIEVIKK